MDTSDLIQTESNVEHIENSDCYDCRTRALSLGQEKFSSETAANRGV